MFKEGEIVYIPDYYSSADFYTTEALIITKVYNSEYVLTNKIDGILWTGYLLYHPMNERIQKIKKLKKLCLE